MRIVEVIGENSDLDRIKDLLVFLNIKGIPSVSVNSVTKELEKYGVSVTYEELEPLIKALDFIEDISQDTITFKDKNSETLNSTEKEDMSKETVKSMADRARRRREN